MDRPSQHANVCVPIRRTATARRKSPPAAASTGNDRATRAPAGIQPQHTLPHAAHGILRTKLENKSIPNPQAAHLTIRLMAHW